MTAGDIRAALREEIADEIRLHQGLRGPMDLERPDVWQNRCECGWDDGDEHPGWRNRYRQHVAEVLLAGPLAGLLTDRERVQRVDGIHLPFHGYCVVCDDGRDTETVGNNLDCPHHTSFCASCDLTWPCPTRRALDGSQP